MNICSEYRVRVHFQTALRLTLKEMVGLVSLHLIHNIK